MNKFSNEEFLLAILSSNVLTPYLQQDSNLAELVNNPNRANIFYPGNEISAKEILPIYKQRLEIMTSRGISENFEATKQFVAYLERYPESRICNVTFEGTKHFYFVRLGITDNDLHIICIMTSDPITNDAFENPT